ncbi:DUF6268 family outer membrane beta-barrel protein [Flavobacterium foetidum]|uniref:DUF6268 family outer membrane beta-barrel protein n=1 Tax=Flavobacterium foetidum TaxID=2026681 RepID=UPI001075819F|nr:DUF6268 family outer membrane beta-barrel protein [Flavobacterium foetidum]KAF2511921.1 hypothetical protein E0W73_16480 [Flavobacterium foetidum]
MKERFLIGAVFLVSSFSLKAQENFSATVSVKTEPTEKINFNQTNIDLIYAKNIGSKNKITNQFGYSNLNVNYEISQYEDLTNLNGMNQILNRFEFLHEISEKSTWNAVFIPTANFQQRLDFSDFTVLGSVGFKYKLTSKTEINIGAGRTAALGYPKFMPLLSLSYQFNKSASVLLGFPDSKISYSNNSRNIFSLTNSFNGNFYQLDNKFQLDVNASKASMSQMTAALEYERNVDKNWFLNFKAGYDFNKKYNLLDSDNHKVYDFATRNGYVLGIGIKYKQ